MNEQTDVEMRVSSVMRDIEDLMSARLNPATAHLLVAEEGNLHTAMTGLQVLLSHIAGGKPALRVVR